ncbi:MMPL family transporter [Mycobacterium sp. NPDC003323]
MLQTLSRWALLAPRRVLVIVALLASAAAVVGVPVAGHLSAGGFQDPAAESSRANRVLSEDFGRSDVQLVLVLGHPAGARSAPTAAAGRQIVKLLQDNENVIGVLSPWASPPPVAESLYAADGRTALIIADLRGGESRAPAYGKELVAAVDAEILPGHPGVTVTPGGSAMVFAQITDQTLRDVLIMESIAVPLSLLVLVWVFGGLAAATLPLVVAAAAIAGSLAVLRLITLWTEVSIFALSLSTALGFALAVDYTLLILSRYRDEIDGGAARDQAVRTTMATAGRTIVFSALIVTLSMSAMVVFPMPFLRSFAYAGTATVALCALAALVLTPTGIVLLGARVGGTGGRHRTRRARHNFWYRSTAFVVRHAVALGLAGSALLIVLGAPFLDARWGNPDDRALPASASAHQVGDVLRAEFPGRSGTESIIVVPDAAGLTAADWAAHRAAVAGVDGVLAVSGPIGSPAGSAFLTVAGEAPLYSQASERQLDELRALPGPAGRGVDITGAAAVNRDGVQAIADRLPVVLGLMAAVIVVVLFALTGSVVLPLKALVLNMLSLSAAFGALVWIFQEGHLGALGTTATGTLVATIPVLLFCIAFGLSMDYEVFLLARIREYWRTTRDQDRSVILGLAHTGRVVTAAALIMSISFAGLVAAQVSFMRMFGVGLVLAVLVDATLVRMVLLPAFMHLLGRWNWWPDRNRSTSEPI